MQSNIFRIARKELHSFFSSPVAFIFLGAFLCVNLFIFFWVETFFARNIADVRPLFEWMPLLLIFLVSAVTMRMWSDELRIGTIEFLFTRPVTTPQLVFGKFLACMALVAVALLLTVPVPVTVSMLGSMDWGPVFGAYLATLLLAAAYTSIGLMVSSRSDNQIVSLIATVMVCACFYLSGSDTLTGFLGNKGGEILKLIGTGSRFSSITRGVIDLRDLYYYFSIVGVFASLNVLSLERLRWSQPSGRRAHRSRRLLTLLLVANFIAGNLWLQHFDRARVDVTRGRIYSISDATRTYLDQLEEPLLIRGYFSAKTHPLLAPLVPQIKDLLREYAVAGHGRVRVEFIDPLENPELEEEAGRKYGIKPVPFRVSDKYQASLVNSYFNVLVQYGDQFETLGFEDLIEVKAQSETDLDVQLRNPEYDITRSIKKVLYGFHSTGDVFASIRKPVTFTGYFSPDQQLPDVLSGFKSDVSALLDEFNKASSGKLTYRLQDPEADGGDLARQINEQFGFRPMRAGLFDTETFYFYMTMSCGDQIVQVPLPENLDKDGLRRSLETALKRFSTGFLKTIELCTPPDSAPSAYAARYGFAGGRHFALLRETLRKNHNVKDTDLKKGTVPEDADILLVAAPDSLNGKQLFALDQFLMKGGTVIVSTSPFEASIAGGTLSASKHTSGLHAWLAHNGISMQKTMVLDPQNANLPIPVKRNLGGFTIQEIRMVEYPYFVDIRGQGLNQKNGLTSGLPQVTLNWASPLVFDRTKNAGRTVTTLLSSSPRAWTSDSTSVLPDFNANGQLGFVPGPQRGVYTLAAVVEGMFDSFYLDRPSPLLEVEATDNKTAADVKEPAQAEQKQDDEAPPVISGTIEKSPESARIIILASNEFATDETLKLAAGSGDNRYLNTLQLLENAVDWSLEDRGLLSIRSRGHFSRTLPPLTKHSRIFWEYLNYGLAFLGLMLVYLLFRQKRSRARHYYREQYQVEGGPL